MKKIIATLVILTILLIIYIPHSPRWKSTHVPELTAAPNPEIASSLYARARGPVLTPTPCTAYDYPIPEKAVNPAFVDTGPFLILTGCKYTPILIEKEYFGVAQPVWNYIIYANNVKLYSKLKKEAKIGDYPYNPIASYSTLMKFRTWKYGFIGGANAMNVAKSKQGVCVDYGAFWAAWLAGNGMEVTAVTVLDLNHAVAMHSDTVFDNQTPFEKREFFLWKWHLVKGGNRWRTIDATLASPFYAAFHRGRIVWKITTPQLEYSIVIDGKTTMIGKIDGYEGYRYVIVGGKTVTRIVADDGAYTVNGRKYGHNPYWAYMTLLLPAPVPSIMAFTTAGTTHYYMLLKGKATYGEWVYGGDTVYGYYMINGKKHNFSGSIKW